MEARRTIWFFSWLTLVFLALPYTRGQSTSEFREILERLKAYPQMIVFNGKIATLDSQMRTVQAMAIRDHRILALGANDEIRKLAGPKTEVIDAKGRMVLPGLIDSHNHPHAWAITHFAHDEDRQLGFAYLTGSGPEIARALGPTIRRKADEVGPGKWIIVHIPRAATSPDVSRMSLSAIGKASLGIIPTPKTLNGNNLVVTRDELDQMAPHNPVVLFASATGGTVGNTQAMQIQQDLLGRELTGLRLWYVLPMDVILRGRYDDIADMLKKELLTCQAAYGITTVSTHIEPLSVIKTLNMMDQKGDLPVRWAWVHRVAFSLTDQPKDFYKYIGDFRGQGSDYF